MNVLTKFKCLICDKVTEPEPEDGYEWEVEEVKDYVCDECKKAVEWAKEEMCCIGLSEFFKNCR